VKIAVIGGVVSTEVLITKLVEHGLRDLHVWGYAPTSTELVSNWRDLAALCARLGISYTPFRKVAECEAELRAFGPDITFAVGLSQLIPDAMLAIARLTNVGFHPTALPKGRGRAPVTWMVLEQRDGAASFFAMRAGVDDGPLYAQEPFTVTAEDDTHSIIDKLVVAEAIALDRWLPRLARGDLHAVEQDHTQATWYGRRTPEDGWINWHQDAALILRLVKAATRPHPGAFTYATDAKVIIFTAELSSHPEQGVVGRILQVAPDGSFLVQTGKGLLRAISWSAPEGWAPKVGALLGYYAESEINELRTRCDKLEKRLAKLEKRLAQLSAPPASS